MQLVILWFGPLLLAAYDIRSRSFDESPESLPLNITEDGIEYEAFAFTRSQSNGHIYSHIRSNSPGAEEKRWWDFDDAGGFRTAQMTEPGFNPAQQYFEALTPEQAAYGPPVMLYARADRFDKLIYPIEWTHLPTNEHVTDIKIQILKIVINQ